MSMLQHLTSGSEVVSVCSNLARFTPRTAVLLISDLEFGGAQRQVVELANNMDPQRFNVYVCTLADYVPLAATLHDRESRLHIIRKRHKFDATVVPRLARFLRKIRADVVHSFLFDADLFGRLSSYIAGVPAIIASERNAEYVPRKRHLWAYTSTRALVDLIIANSSSGADFNSRTFKVPRSKYRVVYNGVDTDRFMPRDCSMLRKELQIPSDRRVVGMFASFKPRKNHLFLLRAARRVIDRTPHVVFLFVGDELHGKMRDSTDYKRKIQSLVDELGLRDHCLFIGNRSDVENYYPLCDITVLPSLLEGTPNVALESMACGVPVIASDVSDNALLIPDTETGFTVPVHDEAILADRILRLLEDEEMRNQMSKRARAWTLTQFSTRRLADQTAAVYEEALQRSDLRRHKFALVS